MEELKQLLDDGFSITIRREDDRLRMRAFSPSDREVAAVSMLCKDVGPDFGAALVELLDSLSDHTDSMLKRGPYAEV